MESNAGGGGEEEDLRWQFRQVFHFGYMPIKGTYSIEGDSGESNRVFYLKQSQAAAHLEFGF